MKHLITHLHTILFGKPTKCPYCESKNISAHLGYAECEDCGKSWSF